MCAWSLSPWSNLEAACCDGAKAWRRSDVSMTRGYGARSRRLRALWSSTVDIRLAAVMRRVMPARLQLRARWRARARSWLVRVVQYDGPRRTVRSQIRSSSVRVQALPLRL